MRAMWKGAISFGFFSTPISLRPAARRDRNRIYDLSAASSLFVISPIYPGSSVVETGLLAAWLRAGGAKG